MTLTLIQIKAILSLLIAFGVPQITVDDVERILLPTPTIIVQSTPVIPIQSIQSPAPIEIPIPVVQIPVFSPPKNEVITEEQAKPKIDIGGERFGDVVNFWWKATGYKESLTCKIGRVVVPQEAEASYTVQSVEPYTLTIICVANKTASRAEKSLTK